MARDAAAGERVDVGGSARERVDVGVVTWNTRDLTVSALRRLLDTDQGCQLRLLVRDNASSDGTADAIARAVPEADVDAGRDNLGFAAGMNSVLARSDAPWFLALNSDAWPEPGAVGALVDTALRHPGAAAVAPRLERPDGELEHSTHPFPSLRVAALTAAGGERWLGRRAAGLLLVPAWQHDVARAVDWAVGAALLMRREAVDDIGGFDERFFMYVEDLEWCWRAHRHGWEIRFEPGAIVRHVGNASGRVGYGDSRTAAYLRNTYRFYRREHGLAATLGLRSLYAAGALRLYVLGKIRRDEGLARFWGRQIRVHLTPVRGPDGPPSRA